ncbi:MAG: hypothetical protein HKN05_20635, partial [Rhizobiales bacterium]|nr:hypothetical protein [Hyphomicrobiales bacterium]
AKGAELDFMIETRGPEHVDEVVEQLELADFKVRVLDSPGGKATPNTKRPSS